MGHTALPQQCVFDLMLEFFFFLFFSFVCFVFFMTVCDVAECMFVRLKKNVGV